MKLNVVNLLNVGVHLIVGVYSIDNTDRDVYLTILPVLIGVVFLSQNQAIQNETRVQVRAAVVIGLLAVCVFLYRIKLGLYYQDDYEVKAAIVLLVSNAIAVILFSWFLINKRKELKGLVVRDEI